MHVQPNRPTDRSHLVLLSVVELAEKQRANDNDRYVLTAHPGKSQGRPPSMLGLEDRGRDGRCRRPPAQIPACASNALGSCLGYERRTALSAKDAGRGRAGSIELRGDTCAPR